jgi:light-regulated signal transduction histidine kinase (bacteriophytochrome)
VTWDGRFSERRFAFGDEEYRDRDLRRTANPFPGCYREVDEGRHLKAHRGKLLEFQQLQQQVLERAGQGTGLGLSIAYDIIKNHDGQIRVVSELGVGTTFSILLPLRKTE